MANTITGRIIEITPIQEIMARNGQTYRKCQLIVDNSRLLPSGDTIESIVAFDVFGDNKLSAISSFTAGQVVTVGFDIRSRKFIGNDGNTRYFNDVDAYSFNLVPQQPAAPQPAYQQPVAPQQPSYQQPVAPQQPSYQQPVAPQQAYQTGPRGGYQQQQPPQRPAAPQQPAPQNDLPF